MTQHRHRRCPTALVAVATLGAFAAAALAGCSSAPSFAEQVAERAAGDTTFELPTSVEGSAWSELLVMCPYGELPESAPTALAEAAAKIGTSSSDALQWLLFDTGDGVTTLTLDRVTVDFCADASAASGTYAPDAQWTSAQRNGVVELAPAA